MLGQMKLHPRVTQTAVDLVKRFEGFRPRAAKTPEGRFTIGYGHVLSPRDSADEAAISEAEAEFLLKHDLAVTADAIEESVLAPVNDNQFAALLSFAFNIGVDNFKGSSAVRRLNEGAYLQAAAALELWRRADFGGEVLVVDQLVRRRAVEKALFLAPPEGFMPLPSSVLRPAFDHSVIGAAVAWAAARERTAVSRIALEGPETEPVLAVPPGREGEPAPSAAIAAADALSVRLSRILPEDEPDADDTARSKPPEPEAPEPLRLEAEDAPANFSEPEAAQGKAVAERAVSDELGSADHGPVEPAFAPANAPLDFTGEPQPASADAPLQFTSAAEPTPSAIEATPRRGDSGFDLPPPPVLRDVEAAPQPFTVAGASAFDAAEPQAHYADAETAAEPPPLVSGGDAPSADFASPSPWRRRFGARGAAEVTPFFEAAGEAPAPSLFDAPRSAAPSTQTGSFDAFANAPTQRPAAAYVAAPPVPLFERPVFFQVMGLIGIALFAGSIFCMLHQASFACLLIGVVGILAMAPAAAFFLFRFLGQPVDPASAEHADLATMMQTAEPAEPQAALDAEPAPNSDSPFDAAWR